MGPRLTKRSNLPHRAWATAVAICAHLAALLLLGWRIPRLSAPEPAEDHGPAIVVTLLRPEVRPRARAALPSPGRAASTPLPSSRVLIAPTPDAAALNPPEPAPPTSAPPVAEANRDDPRLRSTLRGLVGCADPAAYRLTREEREACDQRLAAATPAPVGRTYDAEALAQFDAENRYDPILVRKAHNGCLPRVADRPPDIRNGPPPPTRSGATTSFGLQCARSF
jgi:hypothetical protein